MAALYRNIEAAEGRLESAKRDYLRRWGWNETCNTPGSFWLWRRDFTVEDAQRFQRWLDAGPGPMGWPSQPKPYGVITATMDLAVSMTARELDERPEDASEDDE